MKQDTVGKTRVQLFRECGVSVWMGEIFPCGWFPAVWICHHLVPALMSHSSVGLPFGQGSTPVFNICMIRGPTLCILCYCTNKSFMKHELKV